MFSRTLSLLRKVSSKTSATARAHVGEPQLAQVVAVEQDAAVLGVVETREQPGDGALARARCADESQRLCGTT
jgi:hypothetical protein